MRDHAHSIAQKTTFWLLHSMIVLFCLWLTYYSGVQTIGELLGYQWALGDTLRAQILLCCALLYLMRHAITLFYFLVRRVDWGEVFGLLVFFAMFEIILLLTGGGAFRTITIALNWIDLLAFLLLLAGSYLNSYSEMQRKWWKANSANKGRCYTLGLFKHSIHINYFGDMVLFTGWCLFTQNMWTLALPLLMTGMFIFLHIPGLDRYLSERYGEEFDTYAATTKKLIPFIY